MSYAVTETVWARDDLGASEKLVLLALAKHADDAGVCFPSVATVCECTGMKERGVQGAIKRLAALGAIQVKWNAGRRGVNVYTITPARNAPRTKCTPAPNAPTPRTKCGGTPARNADEPVKEPVIEQVITPIPPKPAEILAAVIPADLAADFVAHRKALKKPMTPRAAELLAAKLDRMHDPGAAVLRSIENGWQGVFEEKGNITKIRGQSNAEQLDDHFAGLKKRLTLQRLA